MRPDDDMMDVPGTERLFDSEEHGEGHSAPDSSALTLLTAPVGGDGPDSTRTKGDLILIPQPTDQGSDPLTWSMWKKGWQLFLLGWFLCITTAVAVKMPKF